MWLYTDYKWVQWNFLGCWKRSIRTVVVVTWIYIFVKILQTILFKWVLLFSLKKVVFKTKQNKKGSTGCCVKRLPGRQQEQSGACHCRAGEEWWWLGFGRSSGDGEENWYFIYILESQPWAEGGVGNTSLSALLQRHFQWSVYDARVTTDKTLWVRRLIFPHGHLISKMHCGMEDHWCIPCTSGSASWCSYLELLNWEGGSVF